MGSTDLNPESNCEPSTGSSKFIETHWVPHPRDVFVLVARMGSTDLNPESNCEPSTGSSTFILIGCPTLATSLFLSLGWDTTDVNLDVTVKSSTGPSIHAHRAPRRKLRRHRPRHRRLRPGA